MRVCLHIPLFTRWLKEARGRALVSADILLRDAFGSGDEVRNSRSMPVIAPWLLSYFIAAREEACRRN
jgi:hypothetical protein